MIRRKQTRKPEEEPQVVQPKGFDDFELRLGDQMRGERATMGKSLLDVQRELRIKAAYIAAIENTDPSVFDTPGFIAGYVRSYARYLNMDPDAAFEQFCRESGFEVAHGMSAEASVVKKPVFAGTSALGEGDPFSSGGRMPFAPAGGGGILSEIEPRAIGSMLVLTMLIAGLSYGAWSVLRQIQQVRVAPVEQAPVVLSDLDPLEGAGRPAGNGTAPAGAGLTPPSAEALDRLYRPQALDVPVLVARDAPISTLDPRRVGVFSTPQPPSVQRDSVVASAAVTPAQGGDEPAVPQVVESAAPQLRMVAVRPSWVRVRAADGTVIFETILESGQTYDVPLMEQPPTLHAGESGAIYFNVNGQLLGPVGERGAVTRDLPLSVAEVSGRFDVADLEQDGDLARMVAEAQIEGISQ